MTQITKQFVAFAPGARIVVRDAEWLVRRVDSTSTGGYALGVVGISELVKDKESIFLTELEKSIEVLDPVDTKLVQDTSRSYHKSLLYMESLLRQTPPTDENLYIGHQAAMDHVPYQLDPAIQALKQPRQRILIADAVGLGKTLEAGILLSELIRRGRGKRILVLAVKSMLTQFQEELWSRFSIPLMRLDSVGIQRIRSHIPTNHNPFYYYDKSIISIDTLKQDAEYRTYIENAYWDIIVIDEAHNVAVRGKGSSLRARLAKLLSRRSDTLIMLSATPHDGRARSFASLMNMLDPTAIANPDEYGPDDIKGLYIRRFKKDIQQQVETAFKERKISVANCDASPEEEAAFDDFVNMTFTRLDQRKGASELFKTTLEKSLFSSPAACLDTIRNRIRRLQKEEDPACEKDIKSLEELASSIQQITIQNFSKYQRLIEVIQKKEHGFGWIGKDKHDRLVIFTERIETLRFLQENLSRDLGLKDNQIEILHGTMSDVDQQKVVKNFGKEEAPVRLLIASDVASEGINLHFLCYRMIHFDIPWSLMVFQQRNGRIDRYGQEQSPQIIYLVTRSKNEKIRGDMRILELLIRKDKEAEKNIGDPAAFMGVYDIEEEENITAKAIEKGQDPAEFEKNMEQKAAIDPLAILMGDIELPTGQETEARTKKMPSLFQDDYAFLEAAIQYLRQSQPIQVDFYRDERRIDLTAPEELKHRFRFYPREIWPDDGSFILSADNNVIKKEIQKSRSREDEKAWPRIHYLWPLNPVIDWANDKLLAAFGRHEAPVITLQEVIKQDETVFILSGLIPNRKGHPLIHHWFGVSFHEGSYSGIESFEKLISRTELCTRRFPNTDLNSNFDNLKTLLPKAVENGREFMRKQRRLFEEQINDKLNEQLKSLERLKGKQYKQLEFRFKDSRQTARKEREQREINQIFDEYIKWVKDTMSTEDIPYIRVVAVLKGTN